ncbi:serine hydrolase [Cryobacterium tepidiphilum]|uniref:Serine hydrolase n=1 Tax=Cryobacterium tepidiphilum TaxID=2486026 RepID=A0A3M8LND4_9MICO|nr:serine hydrolase [Cryobacterium tepidiphilum]RNE66990.1 serine hydrolase [Cryobacterium tepidiphilum]
MPLQDSSRSKHSSPAAGKHKGSGTTGDFSRSFETLGELALDGVQVSARATDLATNRALLSVDDHVVMPAAGIGTVLLLIEVAARLDDDDLGGYTILDREPADAAAGSGIWQHLQAPSLPVADLAALIGATGDNLATNVLIRSIGLAAVRRRAESIGLTRTALLDVVRDERGPDDAPHLSVASAKELTGLFTALARGEVVDQVTSERVLAWLSLNTDLSMVAGAFGLDPFDHRDADHGLLLVNKTGTGVGVRSDAGVLRGPRAGVAYAVSLGFADNRLSTRLAVIDSMRAFGLDLLEYVY